MVHFPLSQQAPSRRHGFTFIEALMVVGVLAVLIALVLPNLVRSGDRGASRSKRISCVSNLKFITLALRLWSNDHGERFPWQVPIQDGGIMPNNGQPGSDFGNFAAAFQSLSNEIVVPTVLICPADTLRKKALSFDTSSSAPFGGPDLRNPTATNVSYMLGWDADVTQASSILSGDPNWVGLKPGVGNVKGGEVLDLTPSRTNTITFGPDFHAFSGNLALSDGSAHQINGSQLTAFAKAAASISSNSATSAPNAAVQAQGKVLQARIVRGL